MKPGDVLFIPRGEPHSAAVSTKHSVHLTIGLTSETGSIFLIIFVKRLPRIQFCAWTCRDIHRTGSQARTKLYSSIVYTS